MADDNVQHGIDDDSSGDAAKGAALGGLGGAAVGAAAGSLIGPVGTVIGAAVGAISGAVGSGAAVAAVDAVDNDNTVSGVGTGATGDVSTSGSYTSTSGTYGGTMNTPDLTPGNDVPGIQTGGRTTAGPDTRGVTEKLADTFTGDPVDDKTGGVVTSGPLQDDLGVVSGGPGNLRGDLQTGNLQDTDRDVMRVPVVEEQLNVGTERREAGEVQVHKHIVEEQVNVPVTVHREEVTVTRHDVDRAVSAGDISGGVLQDGDTIRVPITEEVPVISKEARVTGEVEIAKTHVTEQQTVSDTVRREEVDIDDTTTRTQGDLGTNRSY